MSGLRRRDEDLRKLLIERRLADVNNVIPVMSPKGGVGKTLISTLMALAIAENNFSVGILDLDVTNPSVHVILNLNPSVKPSEDKGVIPPKVHGIKAMSIAYYTKGKPLPLRGSEITEVVREILAITIWGNLDYLIIDTPPGMSDVHLEIISNVGKARPLIVTTPHVLSIYSVRALLTILKETGIPIIGLVENMSENPTNMVIDLCREFKIKYLGNVPLDSLIALSVDNTTLMRKTRAYSKVAEIIKRLSS